MTETEKPTFDSSPKQRSRKTTTGLFWIIAIPAFLLAIVQLYDWLTKSSGPDLVVSTKASTFSLPKKFWADTREFWEDTTELIDSVDCRLKHLEFTQKYKGLDNQVAISLRNGGDLPANDVRIIFDGEGLAEFQWDDGVNQEIVFQTELKIGDLPIEKCVEINIWPEYSTPSSFTIVHSAGKRVVHLDDADSWSWFDLLNPFLPLLLLVIFLIFLVFPLIYARTDQRGE